MSSFIAQEPLYIHGPERYLPSQVIDNQALIKLTNSNYPKEVVAFSTGITHRHWASEEQACSDLAIEACTKLFNLYPEMKSKVRQLILATISGDFPSPPSSPKILHELGIEHAGAMDLGAACAGFVTGLHTAACISVATKQALLLVASEIRSKFLNTKDFGSSVLFGDGAASCILSKESSKASFKLLASTTHADGEIYDTISIPVGGSRNPYTVETEITKTKIRIKNSTGLFVKAVNGMSDVANKVLSLLDMKSTSIDWLIPHQGNKHLVHSVAKQLNISLDKTVQTVTQSGNTSGASNGIGLSYLKNNCLLKSGQKILLTSAGGGGLTAAALLKVV